MKHFRLITLPLIADSLAIVRDELQRNEALWQVDQSRQRKVAVQRHTQNVFLRAATRGAGSAHNSNDIQESSETRFAPYYVSSMRLLHGIAKALDGDLCRALFVRLAPQSVVYPHIDLGQYYACRDRYHLVIDSNNGSVMNCAGETVTMYDGQLWWFDNKAMHDSKNNSQTWRTHLIFDLIPLANVASVDHHLRINS